MHLIFGGSYQGKLDYAKERYQLKEQDIFSCYVGSSDTGGSDTGVSDAGCPLEPNIDFTKKTIYRLEEFILCCVHRGMEAKDYLELNRDKWKDSVILCADISSGIVPYEKELRAWRDMVGRTLMYLGKEAEEVTRMFCGIPQKIK